MRGGVGMGVCRLGEWKKGNKGKRKGRKESAGRVRKRRRRREEEEARAGQGRGEAGRWAPARQERGARALRRSPDRVQAGVGGQLAWGRALIVLLFTRPRPKGD